MEESKVEESKVEESKVEENPLQLLITSIILFAIAMLIGFWVEAYQGWKGASLIGAIGFLLFIGAVIAFIQSIRKAQEKAKEKASNKATKKLSRRIK